MDVYFGPKASVAKELNWIPTSADGQFEVLFRVYGPKKPLFDKTWRLLDIEEANRKFSRTTVNRSPGHAELVGDFDGVQSADGLFTIPPRNATAALRELAALQPHLRDYICALAAMTQIEDLTALETNN